MRCETALLAYSPLELLRRANTPEGLADVYDVLLDRLSEPYQIVQSNPQGALELLTALAGLGRILVHAHPLLDATYSERLAEALRVYANWPEPAGPLVADLGSMLSVEQSLPTGSLIQGLWDSAPQLEVLQAVFRVSASLRWLLGETLPDLGVAVRLVLTNSVACPEVTTQICPVHCTAADVQRSQVVAADVIRRTLANLWVLLRGSDGGVFPDLTDAACRAAFESTAALLPQLQADQDVESVLEVIASSLFQAFGAEPLSDPAPPPLAPTELELVVDPLIVVYDAHMSRKAFAALLPASLPSYLPSGFSDQVKAMLTAWASVPRANQREPLRLMVAGNDCVLHDFIVAYVTFALTDPIYGSVPEHTLAVVPSAGRKYNLFAFILGRLDPLYGKALIGPAADATLPQTFLSADDSPAVAAAVALAAPYRARRHALGLLSRSCSTVWVHLSLMSGWLGEKKIEVPFLQRVELGAACAAAVDYHRRSATEVVDAAVLSQLIQDPAFDFSPLRLSTRLTPALHGGSGGNNAGVEDIVVTESVSMLVVAAIPTPQMEQYCRSQKAGKWHLGAGSVEVHVQVAAGSTSAQPRVLAVTRADIACDSAFHVLVDGSLCGPFDRVVVSRARSEAGDPIGIRMQSLLPVQ
mmetsp:Transcript_73721/g.169022  ORF Transcript_73721/g.169022 Transcript_73721/m.169022 type:complete len:641 (-) Transcript_73721:4-1926(-)